MSCLHRARITTPECAPSHCTQIEKVPATPSVTLSLMWWCRPVSVSTPACHTLCPAATVSDCARCVEALCRVSSSGSGENSSPPPAAAGAAVITRGRDCAPVVPSHGRFCHLAAPHYSSVVFLATKYKEGRLNDKPGRG